MDLLIRNLPWKVNDYELRIELAKVLHGDDFLTPRENERKVNFATHLDRNEHTLRCTGKGKLTLPSLGLGFKFLIFVRRSPVVLSGRTLFFERSKDTPRHDTVQTLLKVPFQDPTIELERSRITEQLDQRLRVHLLQFGIWGRRPIRENDLASFCVEWERNYASQGLARISISYDRKQLIIQLGEPLLDDIVYSVLIKFVAIRDIWIGHDYGNPFVCFDLHIPATFESEWINRTLTGNVKQDTLKYRQRVCSIDDAHAHISQFAYQVRITLYQADDLEAFSLLCTTAALRKPKRARIDAEKHGYFSGKKLNDIEKRLKSLPWDLAFQAEALLHNGFLHTEDVLNLMAPIRGLTSITKDCPSLRAEIMKHFMRKIQYERASVPIVSVFLETRDEMLTNPIRATPLFSGSMNCYHVTFTPTRMTLEGPYPVQSNRVLRRYSAFQDHFLRVEFRDEDRLQYRWDREVDGTELLKQRVGTLLKEGFCLAGACFQFLGYSSSALQTHAVWFMNPFEHPTEGYVNSAHIRRSLGDFSAIRACPSKYAARLAQAFTATDPSVKVTREKWKEMPDIVTIGRPGNAMTFTDGNGTMSPGLAKQIWVSLNNDTVQTKWSLQPDVVQIRIGGYKGVLAVDEHLKDYDMCLRPSMNKFEANEDDVEIEIANVFNRPKPMYLNRPLIMILEDRNVRKETFMDLQEKAVAQAYTARNSAKQFCSLLQAHHFSPAFRLTAYLQRLESLGLDLLRHGPEKSPESVFLDRVVHCAMNSVVRDIKYKARIPVPDSWTLVGVADEGPAYEGKPGYEDLFTLMQGEVYACIQEDGESESTYLKGNCIISRSPTVHPGDVQRVWAVGEPPADRVCLFRHLKNCIVFPSKGERPMPSCLGGGDLDGDEYYISKYPRLLPTKRVEPGDYPAVEMRKIEEDDLIDPITKRFDNERVIPHVCDFIVEYINSHVLGLLSDKHLTLADQSADGVFDERCLHLAKLCSQAVDYPKNGNSVDLKSIPRQLIPYSPDWKKGEVDTPRDTDFYISERAIGHLYRAISINTSSFCEDVKAAVPLLDHPIYRAILPTLKPHLKQKYKDHSADVEALSSRYADELRYICVTHTLSDFQGVQLSEEEVVIGAILAECSRHGWRQERTYRMRYHSESLVKQIRNELTKPYMLSASVDDIRDGLAFSWSAWKFTVEALAGYANGNANSFGLNSFGLIALSAVFDYIDRLEEPQGQ